MNMGCIHTKRGDLEKETKLFRKQHLPHPIPPTLQPKFEPRFLSSHELSFSLIQEDPSAFGCSFETASSERSHSPCTFGV